MTLAEREAVPGIGPRRAEIIVAGAEVFAELLESFSLPGFHYSPLGLRDGILAQMLASRTPAPPRTGNSNMSAGRACSPRLAATASIPPG